MDKITLYRGIIEAILEKYEPIVPVGLDEVENELIFDRIRNRYQLVRVGFENRRRIHYCVFHLDIKNDKIWVQEDRTDVPIVQLLLDAGVPKTDILLGFHPLYRRELSGFPVA